MFITARRSLLAGTSALVLTTGSLAAQGEPCDGNIVDALAGAENFSTLVTAVQTAGLTDALKQDGPFTLFAPSNEAFDKLPPGALSFLLANPETLATVLLYHVSPGAAFASDVTTQPGAFTLAGERIKFSTDGGVFVNDAEVVATDFAVCNGVIHVIDDVLLPSFKAVGSSSFDLVDNLTYLNAKTGEFSTLLFAIETAGLTGALQGPGPFTLFAPTDRAFAQLPPGTLSSLIADPPALADILLYHVVGRELLAVDVATLPGAQTLQGQSLTFTAGPSGVFVDAARVFVANVETSNGVFHAIDAVLLPPSN